MISKEEWLSGLSPEEDARMTRQALQALGAIAFLFVVGVIYSGVMWGFPVQL